MTPEKWERLKELCHSALEHELEDRIAFLGKACLGDEGLVRDAGSMIARATSGGGILNGPIWKDFDLEADPRAVVVSETMALPYGNMSTHIILALENACELIANICEAVEHAHQNGIIHRP
jgi:hypothetical protein